MSGQDEGAVEALMSLFSGHGSVVIFPKDARAILAAIRGGKVPGVNSQGTTDAIAHTVRTCTEHQCKKEIADLRAQLAAAKADVHDMFTRGDAYMHKSDRMERERDALAGLLAKSKDLLSAMFRGDPYVVVSGDATNRSTHAAIMEDISAALDGEGGGDGWVACSESMPERNVVVIVPGGTAEWNGQSWFSHQAHRDIRWEVTHWRPLPTPPATPAKDAR